MQILQEAGAKMCGFNVTLFLRRKKETPERLNVCFPNEKERHVSATLLDDKEVLGRINNA